MLILSKQEGAKAENLFTNTLQKAFVQIVIHKVGSIISQLISWPVVCCSNATICSNCWGNFSAIDRIPVCLLEKVRKDHQGGGEASGRVKDCPR